VIVTAVCAVTASLVAACMPAGAGSPLTRATRTQDVRTGVLLVANQQSASASIVDLATGRVTHLTVGPGPHEAAISADGTVGVVTIYGAPSAERQLAVIDMRRRAVARHIDVAGFRRLHDVAFLPGSSSRVVVTAEASQRVVELDVETGQVTGEIDTRARGSHMLALARDGRTLFTANLGATTASQLDLTTRRFVRHVEAGPRPEGIAITPDGREAWIGSNDGGTVTVVDPGSGRVLTTIPDVGFPYRITISPSGERAIIPDPPRRRVHVFDVATRRSLGAIPVDGEPTGVRIAPDGRTAFVTLGPQGAVLVLDLTERRVLARHSIGAAPDGVAWGPPPS
jgi:DNA-binding beta-propeller fold protein YncE